MDWVILSFPPTSGYVPRDLVYTIGASGMDIPPTIRVTMPLHGMFGDFQEFEDLIDKIDTALQGLAQSITEFDGIVSVYLGKDFEGVHNTNSNFYPDPS